MPSARGPATASTGSFRLRVAALDFLEERTEDLDRHNEGVARLLAGEPDAARRLLERGVSEEPLDARQWSDYAAVLLDAGTRTQDFAMFARSLAASDRALELSPSGPEPMFNRAMALEALQLDGFAKEAFERYLTVDATSGWAGEVRTRLRSLQAPSASRSFADVLQEVEHSGDISASKIDELIAASPRDARRHGESVLLGKWAEATLAGDVLAAQRSLDLATAIGAALERRSGERLLTDLTAATRRAHGRDHRRIAEAILLYRDGRIAFSQWRIGDALTALRQAAEELDSAGHPLAIVARYYVATVLADSNDYRASLQELDEVTRALPRHSIAMRAQILWTGGTVHARMRSYSDAVLAYEEAARLFGALGEWQDAARIRHMLAYVLTLLGRTNEAWRVRAEAFRIADDSRNPQLPVYGAFETAQQAMFEKDYVVAHSFYDLTLDASRRTPIHESAALAERALASWRGGFRERAREELREAERFLPSIADPAMRTAATHALGFVRAVVKGDDDPLPAIRVLRAAIDFDLQRRNSHALPWMLAEEARLRRRIGDVHGAIEDLEMAVDVVRESAQHVSDFRTRDSYLGTVDAIYRSLIESYIIAGRIRDAFSVMERQRSEAFVEQASLPRSSSSIRSIDSVAASLPADGLMLYYMTLGNDLWLIGITPNGHSIHKLTAPVSSVEKDIRALREAIEVEDGVAITRLSRQLHFTLLGPVAGAVQRSSRLIFIIDGPLANLPLAALRDGHRYLVEAAEIVGAPSATVYAELSERRAMVRAAKISIVADPAFDIVRYPALGRLPFASREGRNIAGLYPSARQLQGTDATVARVLDVLNDAPVLHMAVHAVLDRRDPGASALLLAPAGGGGELRLQDLAITDLHRVQLVVLAACRTAERADAPVNLSSLASAFLAAGAGNVLGTLWDVDDATTQDFSIRFHRKIGAGVAPATALRQVQIEMIQSGDPKLRSVASWAGLQLYGPSS